MGFLQSFKSIFMKDDFDYDNLNIDLYDFHPQIRILLVLNGIFFNNQDSYLRFLWPVLSVLLALVGASFQLMFVYHGIEIEDYTFATECFCYFLIITTVPLVYISIIFNRTRTMQLLNSMNRDFLYVCTLGSKYRKTFLQGQLLIWQLCISWLLFSMCVVSMYMGTTLVILLYQSLFAPQHENMERPLMFPLWLPKDDPYRTPNYEIFLFCEIILILVVPQTFCVYVYILFHVLLHHYYIMSFIIYDTEVLFDGLDESAVELPRDDPGRVKIQLTLKNRMRRIVKWHNIVFKSIDGVSSIFGLPLVYQVSISALVICLMAYQVADSIDNGKFNYLFAILCVEALLQLWIPCYLGTLIRYKAFAVGEALWNSGWHETPLGRLIRTDIVIFIMRSQKPVTIKFMGLPNLELVTFSSVVSTSYSYFNILRQYK